MPAPFTSSCAAGRRHWLARAGALLLPAALQARPAHADDPVVVNGQALGTETLQALQRRVGRLQPGRWWYDPHTGAWGPERGPTAGWAPPALPVPAPLRADASGGGEGRLTGVFINGRELHPLDVAGLRQLLGSPPWPGRWWVDAQGNFGPSVGGQRGRPLGNLWAAARQRQSHQPWGIASPDGKQFIGHDGEGVFAKGSRGETYFGR